MTGPRQTAASAWALKMADGELTPDDEAALDAWLEADPENRATFGRMATIWLAAPETADTPEMIAVRADALEAMRAANERRWSRRRLVHRFWPLIAAAASIVLVAALFLTLPIRPQDYQTGIGERRVVRLADGSRLSLDAATRVEVAYSDKARNLTLLSGRAKFDVAHDASKPFSVTAGNRTVVATGTAFSVELAGQQVRVILYQGHVHVVTADRGEAHPLTLATNPYGDARADQSLVPGKVLVASLERPVATVESTDPQRSLSWEGGQLVFTDDPLDLAVERINRYSDTPIIVEGRAARYTISGAFNAGDAAGFVDGVGALYPLRIERRDNAIVLSSAN